MSKNSKAVKRIMRDRIKFIKSNFKNIFINWNEENIMSSQVLLIGPKDTPYENGFFLFDVVFPENYPFKNPKVKFMTSDGHTRFHPNLYTEGKVCLSLLGTWAGPSWSSSQNISSLFLAIQSLLCEWPLTQEPGYSGEINTSKSKNYNIIITHQVYKTSVIQQIKNLNPKFECFRYIIQNHFTENINWYISKLSELSLKHDSKTYKSSIYSMKLTCNFNSILNDIIELYNSINLDGEILSI